MIAKEYKRILFLFFGTILFFILMYVIRELRFIYSIRSAHPYTLQLDHSPSTSNEKTWLIHAYVPDHNAGSEWMAHAINTYLTREKGEKINVISNATSVPKYDGIHIYAIEDTKVPEIISKSNLLFSHHTMEANAVQTAKLSKKPIVLLMHDHHRKQNLREYCKILPKNVYVIHNSKWIQNWYSEYNLPSFVLYPPVDWREYAVERKREFVTLINCNTNKGGKILIEIAKKMPEVQFLGVLGAYNQQIQDTSVPNIRYINSTPQIKEVYARTDILLMPSKEESWGRTAVEAMSSGIPVIAHPTPGLLESCGNAGIYCKRDSIEDWVKEIRKLRSDEAYYNAISAKCKERAIELDPEPQLEALSKWLEKIQWRD